MTVEDLRNDPSRRPNPLALQWVGATGTSKHFASGGPEDEAGRVTVSPKQTVNGQRYSYTAEHYQPYNRGSDVDPWSEKTGDGVVKTQFRGMVAGQALLNRLQTRSMS